MSSLYGDGGTECGSLGRQYFWSSREPSQTTFWQSWIALLNVVTEKVKATKGDHDRFIDKPSYPLGSTTSQHKDFASSHHFTLWPHAFPATVDHIPSDHTQNTPFLPSAAFVRCSVRATSNMLKIRNPPMSESKPCSHQIDQKAVKPDTAPSLSSVY